MTPTLHVLLVVFTFMRRFTCYFGSTRCKYVGHCCGDPRCQGSQIFSLFTMSISIFATYEQLINACICFQHCILPFAQAQALFQLFSYRSFTPVYSMV